MYALHVLLNILQFIVIFNIILTVGEIDYNRKQLAISVAILTAYYSTFVYWFDSFAVVIFFYFFILVPVYHFLYKQKWANSVMLAIIQYFAAAPVELILNLIEKLGVSYDDQWGFVFMRALTTFLLFLMSLAITYIQRLTLHLHINKKMKWTYLMYLIFAVVITWSNIIFFEDEHIHPPIDINLYNTIIILAFVCLSIYNTFKVNEAALKSQQIELQQMYTGTLEASIENLRDFKHDFSNIMQSINGYIRLDDMKALETYMAGLNLDLLKTSSVEIATKYLRDIPVLYGLLLSKLSLAESSGVDFHVTILSPNIKFPHVSLMDASRMIGILLDNALEEAALTESKYASLVIEEYIGRNKITVTNAFRGEVDIQKIFEDGYTTKENHQGHGLHYVRKVIDDYRRQGILIELDTEIFYDNLIQSIIV